MKLTYWKAQCMDDDDAYSIRTKTLRECKARVQEDREQMQAAGFGGRPRFSAPEKVVIEYADAFDLMRQLTGEGCDA